MKTLWVGMLALAVTIGGTASAYQQFIVNSKQINVRTKPINGHVLGTLRAGDEVTVYGTRAGWALLSQPGVPEQWVNVALLSPKGSVAMQAEESGQAYMQPAPMQSSAQTYAAPMSAPMAGAPSRSLSGKLPGQTAMSAPAMPAPAMEAAAMPAPAPMAMAEPAPAPVRASVSAKASAPAPKKAMAMASADVQGKIAAGAFAEASRKFSKHEVEIMRRGATQMVQTGRCQHVEFAYKSTINPSEYYVYCGGNRRVIFTEADLNQ